MTSVNLCARKSGTYKVAGVHACTHRSTHVLVRPNSTSLSEPIQVESTVSIETASNTSEYWQTRYCTQSACSHRHSHNPLTILSHSQEGSVSHVSFSPTENCLAVCSGGGYVGLWELNLQEQGVSKVSEMKHRVGAN